MRREDFGVADATPTTTVAFDFTRPFLPEARVDAALDALSSYERLRLNQIRGHAALTLLPLMDALAERRDPATLRWPDPPLVKLRTAFEAEFGAACHVIDPLATAAGLHDVSRPARALLALHRSWIAQRHGQAAALDTPRLEPAFRRLLLDRWVDTALPGSAAAWPGPQAMDASDAAVEGYRRLCRGLAEALYVQFHLDLRALEAVCGYALHPQIRTQAFRAQADAYGWTYVGCGLGDLKAAHSAPGAAADCDPPCAAFG